MMPGKTTPTPRKPGAGLGNPATKCLPSHLGSGVHRWMAPSALNPEGPLPPFTCSESSQPHGACREASGPEEPCLSHMLQESQEGASGCSLAPHQSQGGHLGEKYGQWVAPAIPASLIIVAPFTRRSVLGWTIDEMATLLLMSKEMITDQVNK